MPRLCRSDDCLAEYGPDEISTDGLEGPWHRHLDTPAADSPVPVSADAATSPTPDPLAVIREALAAPTLLEDPATARVSPAEMLEHRASVIYWALFDAGLLTEASDG